MLYSQHNSVSHGHVRRHLIYRCFLLLLILAGCAPTQPVQSGALPPITIADARLLSGGVSFEVRGVNYIHPSSADLSKCSAIQFGADANCPWEIGPIAADFDKLRGLGVNTVRVFLNYYVFGGARAADPNYSLEQPLAHLDTLIAEASKRGIYVLPVLLAKYPQDRFRPEDYSTALELHVRPVVRHLAGKPGLLAWDLFNEPDLGGPVDQRCWDWDNADFPLCFPLANERLHFVKAIHDEVKRLDPTRLTTVSLGFAKNYFEPDKADLRLADVVDIYAFHYYDDDPYDSGRYAAHWYYGKGFPADLRRAIDELAALQPSKPIVITELGFPTGPDAKRTAEQLPHDLATGIQTARDAGAGGVMLWPFQTDLDVLVGKLFTK
ncbi:MAG TPA: cellulase family glycosylhydrolase [Roseiflexaceae bacterium]|nr:cellulase family glycosylhydrolase [Roseiflexaceae bacterium]